MQYHMSNDSIQLQFAVDQVLLISGHDLENKKNAA